jgi:NAD(P)-dependent dehydrogenase (short-subunit alcohol dehydrogenase family)
MQSVVVTGTSTGIGWGTAKVLIARGFRVFGSVRRTEDAERLGRELGPGFVPLHFDVTDEPAVRRAATQVSAELPARDAGGEQCRRRVSVRAYLPIEEFRQQIEINLTGQLIRRRRSDRCRRRSARVAPGRTDDVLGRRPQRLAVPGPRTMLEVRAEGLSVRGASS